MEDKRYYWIKLKTDFFESDKIDFIMSQQNGSDYIVLYQMLCLKSANNDGLLGFKMGDMLLKWDESKIQRECKYFSIDTIKVALTLYRQLGLIYEGDDEFIRISNFEDMVGSESKWAKYKRDSRKLENVQNVLENVQEMSNKRIEIENRDRIIDIDKESKALSFPKESTIVATTTNEEIKENLQLRPAKEKKEKFVKPTIEDVEQYCKERDNGINAIKWYDYYEANGWRVGKNPMKDWKAAVRTWEHNYKKDNIESKNNISSLPEFEY